MSAHFVRAAVGCRLKAVGRNVLPLRVPVRPAVTKMIRLSFWLQPTAYGLQPAMAPEAP